MDDALSKALRSENAIAADAFEVWESCGDSRILDAERLAKLMPLLRQPIPPGFITTTPAMKGKPYESTGIRSVQVCIDRMDNVLLPHNWTFRDVYEQDGKLCRVTVVVWGPPIDGTDTREALVSRTSYGGVDRASGLGNLMKGSFTNAAKRAFAMVGVGHEVYLGAADGDPDTDVEAAKELGKKPKPPKPKADSQKMLDSLLNQQDDLSDLRARANVGMEALGANVNQRARELAKADTREALDALLDRISNTMDVMTNNDEGESDG